MEWKKVKKYYLELKSKYPDDITMFYTSRSRTDYRHGYDFHGTFKGKEYKFFSADIQVVGDIDKALGLID